MSPFFTGELKSTFSADFSPETWLPTSTLTTALSEPLAVTYCTRSPRVTGAVSYLYSPVDLGPQAVSTRSGREKMAKKNNRFMVALFPAAALGLVEVDLAVEAVEAGEDQVLLGGIQILLCRLHVQVRVFA